MYRNHTETTISRSVFDSPHYINGMSIAGTLYSLDLPTEMSVSTSGFDVVSKYTTTTIVDKNSRGKEGSEGGKVRMSVIRFTTSMSPESILLHKTRDH
jgi:hypothetical protein